MDNRVVHSKKPKKRHFRRIFSFVYFRDWLKHLTGSQEVFLGFFLIALAGALILMLPISNNYGIWTNPIDALFTSISSVCVTGLVVVPTGSYWNLFGQIIIIILIQIGGLGFMTFMTLGFIAAGRRISIHDRLVIRSAINSDQISGVVTFVKRIMFLAFTIEFIGAILLSFVFIPQFGFLKGIYFSLWHSISMYCNAGFDLMASIGENSFNSYVNNVFFSLTVSLLIIIGGLGFSVYVDLLDYPKRKKLTLHTRAVLYTTAFLLIGGSLLFFYFEHDNPLTMGHLPWYGKLSASFFQATTPRTAGAQTINQYEMTAPSLVLTDLLMFIGASPGSTGGGIKTTTIFVIFITVYNLLMGRRDVNIMKRRISQDTILHAMAIFLIGVLILGIGYFILMIAEPEINISYLLFELLSAYGTVGLSCGITSDLSYISKIILIICMFVGRVGPLTIAYIIYNTEKRQLRNSVNFKLPPGNILLG